MPKSAKETADRVTKRRKLNDSTVKTEVPPPNCDAIYDPARIGKWRKQVSKAKNKWDRRKNRQVRERTRKRHRDESETQGELAQKLREMRRRQLGNSSAGQEEKEDGQDETEWISPELARRFYFPQQFLFEQPLVWSLDIMYGEECTAADVLKHVGDLLRIQNLCVSAFKVTVLSASQFCVYTLTTEDWHIIMKTLLNTAAAMRELEKEKASANADVKPLWQATAGPSGLQDTSEDESEDESEAVSEDESEDKSIHDSVHESLQKQEIPIACPSSSDENCQMTFSIHQLIRSRDRDGPVLTLSSILEQIKSKYPWTEGGIRGCKVFQLTKDDFALFTHTEEDMQKVTDLLVHFEGSHDSNFWVDLILGTFDNLFRSEEY